VLGEGYNFSFRVDRRQTVHYPGLGGLSGLPVTRSQFLQAARGGAILFLLLRSTRGVTVSRYAQLPDLVRNALANVEPSKDRDLSYYPCRVTLRNGVVLDTVYIEPEKPYLRMWGVYPEDDRGKRFVSIDDVVSVENSPQRLPARFANEIYRNGESGMGYTVFTVVFVDGTRQACVTGNAVDFIRYPEGKGPSDVIAVRPHEGRNAGPWKAPEWYWCLYSEAD
jgi:hypothetical protein